jgi:hypothetical protein
MAFLISFLLSVFIGPRISGCSEKLSVMTKIWISKGVKSLIDYNIITFQLRAVVGPRESGLFTIGGIIARLCSNPRRCRGGNPRSDNPDSSAAPAPTSESFVLPPRPGRADIPADGRPVACLLK